MAKIGNSPCYMCQERYVGCHSNCTRGYREFAQRKARERAERMRESELDHAAHETSHKKAKRHTDKWGGKG